MLLLNALLVGGRQRKQAIVVKSFLPADEFLSRYYANSRVVSFNNRWFYVILHWLVLACPAGLIRRTIGQFIWGNANEDSFIV
jgi:hypothetical protein